MMNMNGLNHIHKRFKSLQKDILNKIYCCKVFLVGKI